MDTHSMDKYKVLIVDAVDSSKDCIIAALHEKLGDDVILTPENMGDIKPNLRKIEIQSLPIIDMPLNIRSGKENRRIRRKNKRKSKGK